MVKHSNFEDVFDAVSIVSAVREIFQEAQTTVATHRRLFIQLRGVMERSSELNLSVEFNSIFCRMVGLVLNTRKNYKPGDRVVSFVVGFTKGFRAEEEHSQRYVDYIDSIFQYIMQGIEAKNHFVRYRVCHLMMYLVHEIPSDHLEFLRDKLTVRIYDINIDVRIKAVIAYAAFQNDDGGEMSEAGKKIQYIMQNDERAEMRRQCLLMLEKNKQTEPFIVERARDTDAGIRKTLYSKVLPGYSSILSISPSNRVRLLQWGLRDRVDEVRDACKNWLTTKWYTDCGKDVLSVIDAIDNVNSDIGQLVLRTIFNASPEFLENVKFNEEFYKELTIPTSLLARVCFEYCKDENKNQFMENNFPMASVFADIVKQFIDSRLTNQKLLDEAIKNDDSEEVNLEGLGIVDPLDYDFINLQLLKMAIDYDYSDEFGRSKLYNILRNTLSSMNEHKFSDELLEALMECLRKLAVNERDFCQVVVEIIYDIKDNIYDELHVDDDDDDDDDKRKKRGDDDSDSDDEDDSYHSALNDISKQSMIEANKSRQEELNQISKLTVESLELLLNIIKYMLRLMFLPLGDNIPVISMHNNFILPCLNGRTETEIRILALECHGLCGLLDKDVAIGVMVVAAIFVSKSEHPKLIESGIKVMCDLLATHGVSIVQGDREKSIDTMAVARVFYRTIKNDKIPEAQAIVAEGLFKLFLCNVIDDEELLEMTILKYFDPMVLKNDKLKQCLEFCIPTYCYARESHQALLAKICEDTIRRLFRDWDNIQLLNSKEWVNRPTTIKFLIEKFSEWTCPWNLALLSEDEMRKSGNHIDFGISLLKLMREFDPSRAIEKRLFKPMITQLSQIVLTPEVGVSKLVEFKKELCNPQLFKGQIHVALQDKTCANSFSRILEFTNECLHRAQEIEGVAITITTPDEVMKREVDPEIPELENKAVGNAVMENNNNESEEEQVIEHSEGGSDDKEPVVVEQGSSPPPAPSRKTRTKKTAKKQKKIKQEPLTQGPDDSGIIIIDSD